MGNSGGSNPIAVKGSTIKMVKYKSKLEQPTVLDLRKAIEESRGVPLDRMRLFYKSRPLCDDALISDFIFENIPMIHLYMKIEGAVEMKIKIPTDKTVVVKYDCKQFQQSTFLDLKKSIEDQEGIPTGQISLFYKSRPLCNDALISEVIFEKNPKIDLNLKLEGALEMEIKMPSGKTVVVNYDCKQFQQSTFLDLKKSIEEKEGIPTGRMRRFYVYESRPLCDDALISDFIFEKNPKLHLNLKIEGAVEIKMETLSGKTVVVNYDCKQFQQSTVLDLKKSIEEKERIPPDQQRLIYEGYQLDDDDELSEVLSENNPSIHLILRLPGGGIPFETIGDGAGRRRSMDCLADFDQPDGSNSPMFKLLFELWVHQ
ncbi:unnamed protein product [Knipowitschia caucasica]